MTVVRNNAYMLFSRRTNIRAVAGSNLAQDIYFLQFSTLCFFIKRELVYNFLAFGLAFCCFCCLFSVRKDACGWLVWRLCMCLLLLLLPIFGCCVLYHWIMFALLLYLILVSVYYSSLITINVLEIFVGIDDIPLLKVIFLLCH